MACVRIAGGSEEKMEKQSEATANSIASQLQTVANLTPEIGVELLKMVRESQLFEKDKAACAEKIQAKVDVDEESAADTNKQTHDHFHEYIQRGHIMSEEAFAPAADFDSRLRIYARLAREIGLNYPTEDTMAKITACAFPEIPTQDFWKLEGDPGLGKLQRFKSFFRAIGVKLAGREPAVFPHFAEFEVACPSQFRSAKYAPGMNDPVIDGLNALRVIEISNVIPRRNTRSTVSHYAPRPRSSAVNRGISAIMDREEVSLPGFRLCPPQSPHPRSRYPELLDRPDPSPTPSPERAMPPGGSSLQMPDLLAPPAALPAVPAPVASELAVPGAEAASEPAAAHGAKTVVEMIAIMDEARGGALTAKAKKGAQKTALQKKPAAAKAKKPAAAKEKKKPAAAQKKKRSIEVERSVMQVLARTGADTTPKSKSFKYDKISEVPKMKAAAERWLKSMGV